MEILVSIILPLYKQKDQVETIINTYEKNLDKLKISYEILLIINGFDDGSFTLAQKLTTKKNHFKIFQLKNGGWGRAVKFGLSKATGKFLCYTNSARTNIKDLITIINYGLVNEKSLVKASRIIRQSFLRKLGSVLYNFEFRLFYKAPVWDINGTPKIFSQKIYKIIKPKSNDDLIDAEILAKCFKYEIPIIEIPIRNFERINGKSTTNFKSALKMYKGLFKIKKIIK